MPSANLIRSPLSVDTFRLLRIPFSALLMPVYFLALSQAKAISVENAVWTFVILHLFVYPASNGYNSYIDKDETSIGGLERPPKPTAQLYYLTLTLDIIAVLISVSFIGARFAACIIAYIIASRAYSSPVTRLKKRPWAGFFTVSIFQGAFTYFTCITGISAAPVHLDAASLFFMIAASANIAAAYPLTQIYQHNEDLKRGDITLSILLGYRGTFLFSGAMAGLATVSLVAALFASGHPFHFAVVAAMLLIPSVYFTRWYREVINDPSKAGFRQSMRMSGYASFSLSTAFIILFILNRLQ